MAPNKATPQQPEWPQSGLCQLTFKGLPREALTTKETAEVTGVGYRDILAMIKAGRVRVLRGCRSYIIPVSELGEILAWAELAEFRREQQRLTGRRGPRM